MIPGTVTDRLIFQEEGKLKGPEKNLVAYYGEHHTTHIYSLGWESNLGSISQRVRTSPNLGLVLRDIKNVQLVLS